MCSGRTTDEIEHRRILTRCPILVRSGSFFFHVLLGHSPQAATQQGAPASRYFFIGSHLSMTVYDRRPENDLSLVRGTLIFKDAEWKRGHAI